MLRLATADADLPKAHTPGPWNPDAASPILGRLECAAILSDIIRASMVDFITVDAKGAIRFKAIGPPHPPRGGDQAHQIRRATGPQGPAPTSHHRH